MRRFVSYLCIFFGLLLLRVDAFNYASEVQSDGHTEGHPHSNRHRSRQQHAAASYAERDEEESDDEGDDEEAPSREHSHRASQEDTINADEALAAEAAQGQLDQSLMLEEQSATEDSQDGASYTQRSVQEEEKVLASAVATKVAADKLEAGIRKERENLQVLSRAVEEYETNLLRQKQVFDELASRTQQYEDMKQATNQQAAFAASSVADLRQLQMLKAATADAMKKITDHAMDDVQKDMAASSQAQKSASVSLELQAEHATAQAQAQASDANSMLAMQQVAERDPIEMLGSAPLPRAPVLRRAQRMGESRDTAFDVQVDDRDGMMRPEDSEASLVAQSAQDSNGGLQRQSPGWSDFSRAFGTDKIPVDASNPDQIFQDISRISPADANIARLLPQGSKERQMFVPPQGQQLQQRQPMPPQPQMQQQPRQMQPQQMQQPQQQQQMLERWPQQQWQQPSAQQQATPMQAFSVGQQSNNHWQQQQQAMPQAYVNEIPEPLYVSHAPNGQPQSPYAPIQPEERPQFASMASRQRDDGRQAKVPQIWPAEQVSLPNEFVATGMQAGGASPMPAPTQQQQQQRQAYGAASWIGESNLAALQRPGLLHQQPPSNADAIQAINQAFHYGNAMGERSAFPGNPGAALLQKDSLKPEPAAEKASAAVKSPDQGVTQSSV